MLAEYPHFVRLARRLQWDADAFELTADARAWPRIEPGLRARLLGLVAGFCLGEARVAAELEPFAARAGDADMLACFHAQRRDEARHARFFDRVAAEVVRVPADTAPDRCAALRPVLGERYLELFERRLPAVADDLGRGQTSLPEAVGVYHMVLEGVVFTAGLTVLLELLAQDPPALPGLRHGAELVLRDERWHVGFGTRALSDAGLRGAAAARVLSEGEAAADVWADIAGEEIIARTLTVHRRRLATVGIHPAGAGMQAVG